MMAELGCQQQVVGRKNMGQKAPGGGINDFTSVERREGVSDVKIGGKFEPVYREPT